MLFPVKGVYRESLDARDRGKGHVLGFFLFLSWRNLDHDSINVSFIEINPKL